MKNLSQSKKTEAFPKSIKSLEGGSMTEFSDAWSGGDDFVRRHIGPSASEQEAMLTALDFKSMDQFIDATVPKSIRCKTPFKTQAPMTEADATKKLRTLAQKNQLFKSYIG